MNDNKKEFLQEIEKYKEIKTQKLNDVKEKYGVSVAKNKIINILVYAILAVVTILISSLVDVVLKERIVLFLLVSSASILASGVFTVLHYEKSLEDLEIELNHAESDVKVLERIQNHLLQYSESDIKNISQILTDNASLDIVNRLSFTGFEYALTEEDGGVAINNQPTKYTSIKPISETRDNSYDKTKSSKYVKSRKIENKPTE